MRITYRYGIRTFSGRVGNIVHTTRNKGRVAIGRDYVKPKLVQQNYIYGEIRSNIASIWKECSAAFKNDMKIYTGKRITSYSGDEIPAYSNYANFVRFLYKFREENPTIELAVVTKNELQSEGCPDNVADIVSAGLLPSVEDVSELTNNW